MMSLMIRFEHGMTNKNRTPQRPALSSLVLALTVTVVVVLGVVTFYSIVLFTSNSNSSSSSTGSSESSSTLQGILTGYVTVGPSQPVCRTNESCTVDLTGYSLLFSHCGTASNSMMSTSSSSACTGQTFSASLGAGGHYSILLSPGNYTITGLSPSCDWLGCSTTFPMPVTVDAGEQVVVNVNVDTGIR